MDLTLQQQSASLKIKTILDKDKILIHHLKGYEEISSPFEFQLDLYSSVWDLDLAKLLGTEVVVSFSHYDKTNKPKEMRYFCGIIGKLEQKQTLYTPTTKDLTAYQAYIYPKLWLLKLSRDYRIFQNKKTIDIILEVLKENKVTDLENLVSKSGQTVREYCVQYGESHFDFVSRLMEEEGIFYFFKHTPTGHQLVLADHNSAAKPAQTKPITLNSNQMGVYHPNVIHQFTMQQQIVVKDFQTVDYNYLTPTTRLQPKISGDGKGGRIYEYPGKFEKLNQGENLSNCRIQALEWPGQLCQGSSTVCEFSAGKTFELADHPRKNFNHEYILYRVEHTISPRKPIDPLPNQQEDIVDSTPVYQNVFSAFPSHIPFRPQITTLKPRIYSNQTAIVTGPPEEEIYCDKYGRIKVHFHWDLYGKKDEKSSCWVRVAQNWAGTNWGGLVIPRIGMEVVVTYIEGDPDRPLVMGCVYNADHTPPDYVSKSPTKSTFKTNTSKKGGGFNELRFEDKKDNEEIYFHAQKDWNNEIEHSRKEDIFKGDDTLTLHKGNKTEIQNGDKTTHVLKIKDGDKLIEIKKGNQKTSLTEGDSVLTLTQGDNNITLKKGNYQLTLDKGNVTIKVTGKVNIVSTDDISLTSDKNITLKAGMNIKFDAKQNVQTMAGMNIKSDAKMSIESKASMSIKQQASMSIERKSDMMIKDQGTMIKIEGQMMTEIKGGLMAKIEGGAMCMVKGAITKIN